MHFRKGKGKVSTSKQGEEGGEEEEEEEEEEDEEEEELGTAGNSESCPPCCGQSGGYRLFGLSLPYLAGGQGVPSWSLAAFGTVHPLPGRRSKGAKFAVRNFVDRASP